VVAVAIAVVAVGSGVVMAVVGSTYSRSSNYFSIKVKSRIS